MTYHDLKLLLHVFRDKESLKFEFLATRMSRQSAGPVQVCSDLSRNGRYRDKIDCSKS